MVLGAHANGRIAAFGAIRETLVFLDRPPRDRDPLDIDEPAHVRLIGQLPAKLEQPVQMNSSGCYNAGFELGKMFPFGTRSRGKDVI